MTRSLSGQASTTPSSPTLDDPSEQTAMEAMQDGNQRLEEGDVEGAREFYRKSVEVKKTASGCFNLGVSGSV